MYNVSISRCDNYEYENVKKAVFQCLDRIIEIKQKIKPQAKVLIKANLAKAEKPEKAVTTHPSVIQAIAEYFQKAGCHVIIGDSPGAPQAYVKKNLNMVYKETGMLEVAKNTGCELNYDTSSLKVVNDKAVCLKEMSIIKVAEDVDFVISAAKLKTHALMMYTGAVKNLFGVIPGRLKMNYHLMMDNANSFAEHLVDICEYVMPVLSILDAVEGMEGNGPSAGDTRNAGLIMASENPYALDLTAIHAIGMDPKIVPIINVAANRNLFSGEIKDLSILGTKLEDIQLEPFKLPFTAELDNSGIPDVRYDLCSSCGVCVESCPPKAIEVSFGKPVIKLYKCIKCFCCQEMCPNKAIEIKKAEFMYFG